MNKDKNIEKVVKNLQNKIAKKRAVYMEMSYVRAIQTVADSIIPYNKSNFDNLPCVE